jgi:hypothetical protein
MRLNAVVLRLVSIATLGAACHPLHLADEATLARLGDEELCGRRSNLLNGPLMLNELARRGVDCGPHDEAALRRGFHLSFLAPTPPSAPGPTAAGSAESPAAAAAPPPDRVADDESGGEATPPGPIEASPAQPPPPPDPPAPARHPAAAAARPPPVAAAAAPLVSPACAARSVRTDEDDEGRAALPPGRWAVTFRNACRFPIRVLYAQRPDGGLTGVTELLRPGESSAPAPIENGFRHPGSVVCSYEAAPEDTPCRLSGNGR